MKKLIELWRRICNWWNQLKPTFKGAVLGFVLGFAFIALQYALAAFSPFTPWEGLYQELKWLFVALGQYYSYSGLGLFSIFLGIVFGLIGAGIGLLKNKSLIIYRIILGLMITLYCLILLFSSFSGIFSLWVYT